MLETWTPLAFTFSRGYAEDTRTTGIWQTVWLEPVSELKRVVLPQLGFPAIAILIAFAIKTLLDMQKLASQKADQKNKQNFKMLENGFGQINGAYEISVNALTGRMTYNQNK
mgnify:CR=1 FL=1